MCRTCRPLEHLAANCIIRVCAVAICCGLAESGYVILDPTKQEEQVVIIIIILLDCMNELLGLSILCLFITTSFMSVKNQGFIHTLQVFIPSSF